MVLLGRCPHVPGRVRVSVEIIGGKGWRKNRDLDNCLKAILDILQHKGIILDDGCETVTSVAIRYTPGKKSSPAAALVEIISDEDSGPDQGF
jgi:Holliday junction resolvase RusA-like endonuclease